MQITLDRKISTMIKKAIFEIKISLSQIKFFFIVIILLSLVSCAQKKRKSYGERITAGIERAPMMQRVPHEYWEIDMDHPIEIGADSMQNKVADISYIPLDSTELIGEVDRVFLYNEKIYIVDSYITESVFIFDKNGRLLRLIDDKGQGPEEYIGLGSISIDTSTQELCLKDRLSNRTLYYDLEGNFLRRDASSPGFYMNAMDGHIFNQLAFGQSYDENLNYHIVVSHGDSICYKAFPFAPIQKHYTVSRVAESNFCNELLFTPTLSDTVYCITSPREYYVKYVIKHEHSIWDKSQEELSVQDINRMIKQDGYTAFGSNVYETSNYLFFSLSEGRNDFIAGLSYFYDKRCNQLFRIAKGYEGSIRKLFLKPIGVSGDYCLALVNGYFLKETLKKYPSLSIADESLRKMVDNCGENSNPILIKYRLK